MVPSLKVRPRNSDTESPGAAFPTAVRSEWRMTGQTSCRPTASASCFSATFERTNYPLTLLVVPGAGAAIRILYMKPRIAAESVNRILEHLRNVLTAMPGAGDRPISSIALQSEEEVRKVTVGWNATAHELDS